MKLIVTTREYDQNLGDYLETEIEFTDVKSYGFVDRMFAVTKENGDVHATARPIQSYVATQE